MELTRERVEQLRDDLISGKTNFQTRIHYDMLLDYVLLCLCTHQPILKTMFYDMKITNTKSELVDQNRLVWGRYTKGIIMKNSKTCHHLNKDMVRIMRMYLHNRRNIVRGRNDNLFVKFGCIPFNHPNDITRRVKRVIGGKGIQEIKQMFSPQQIP